MIVYRTDNAGVVAAFEAWQIATAARRDERRALIEAAGLDPDGIRTFRSNNFAGVEHEGDVPTGWRRAVRLGLLVPNRRTNVGKELERRLDELGRAVTVPRLTGMLGFWHVEGRFYEPAMHLMENDPGKVYVRWGMNEVPTYGRGDSFGAISGEEFAPDPSIWERVKLSEWHRLAEKLDEQRAGASR